MINRNTTLPPAPWSMRMRNASDVLQAYLDLGRKHKADFAAAQSLNQIESQNAIQNKINAVELQIDAAIAQMWIIRDEEEQTK